MKWKKLHQFCIIPGGLSHHNYRKCPCIKCSHKRLQTFNKKTYKRIQNEIIQEVKNLNKLSKEIDKILGTSN